MRIDAIILKMRKWKKKKGKQFAQGHRAFSGKNRLPASPFAYTVAVQTNSKQDVYQNYFWSLINMQIPRPLPRTH